MSRKQEAAEITRQNLLRAALNVFSRKGYDGSTVDDIAHEAGVTRGALYHHFKSKAGLYHALVMEIAKRIDEITTTAVEQGGSPLEVIRRIFVKSTVFASVDPEARAVNLLSLRVSRTDDGVEQALREQMDGLRNRLSQIRESIRQGINSGDIRSDVDPDNAALAMMALADGLMLIWLQDPSLFELSKAAEQVADLFVAGIAAR